MDDATEGRVAVQLYHGDLKSYVNALEAPDVPNLLAGLIIIIQLFLDVNTECIEDVLLPGYGFVYTPCTIHAFADF